MKETGILLTETNDFNIKVVKQQGIIMQGLQIGNVTKQNASIIIRINPGEIKEYPAIGVGIDNMLLGHDTLLYKHRIRQQLTADGMRVKRLDIQGQNIEIDAKYI